MESLRFVLVIGGHTFYTIDMDRLYRFAEQTYKSRITVSAIPADVKLKNSI